MPSQPAPAPPNRYPIPAHNRPGIRCRASFNFGIRCIPATIGQANRTHFIPQWIPTTIAESNGYPQRPQRPKPKRLRNPSIFKRMAQSKTALQQTPPLQQPGNVPPPRGGGYPAPCTLHPVPCTLYPAPCTLHPVPCTLHPVPCTLYPVKRLPNRPQPSAHRPAAPAPRPAAPETLWSSPQPEPSAAGTAPRSSPSSQGSPSPAQDSSP